MQLYNYGVVNFGRKLSSYNGQKIYIPYKDLLPHEQDYLINVSGYSSGIARAKQYYGHFLLTKAEVKARFPDAYTDPFGNTFSDKKSFPVCTVDGDPGFSHYHVCHYPGAYTEAGNYRWETYVDDDDCEEYGLPGYHTQMPKWRLGCNKGKLIGIELEVDTDSSEDLENLIGYVQDRLGSSYAIIESDGSLEEYGAEIVFKPMTLPEMNDGKLEKAFKNIARYTRALKQPTGYGMHCNISNEWFDGELHQLKFAHLMHGARPLTAKVALRNGSNHCAFSNCKLTQKKSLGKYSIVNIQDRRCEVRAFRASLHWGRFQLQVQYCLAMIDFSRENSILNLTEESFINWLSKQTNKADYKLLGWFCCPDKFRPIKGQNKFWETSH